MQRSSPSIAALATALAKAQIELANPEKSLTGTIEPQAGQGGARQFRYVRRCRSGPARSCARPWVNTKSRRCRLPRWSIRLPGIVNLTTILAHASGEWDRLRTAGRFVRLRRAERPHRMGAALTYARRYALFTLVGIAGEDDLDAPDLISPSQPTPGHDRRPIRGNGRLDSKSSGLAARTPLVRPAKPTANNDNARAKVLAAVRLDITASAQIARRHARRIERD